MNRSAFGPDLLGELAGGALLGRLARDVELAGGQLQERLVDRAPVLAHEQDVLAVGLERHDAHGVEGPHDLALEGEAVGADEGADDDLQPLAGEARPLADLAEGAPVGPGITRRRPLELALSPSPRAQEGTLSRS